MKFIVIFLLIFSHCLGDMAFQTDFIAKFKSTKLFAMISHLIIWTGCITVVLLSFEIFSYWKLAFLFLGHGLVDSWKCRQPKDEAHFHYIYYDQALHLIQLMIVLL